MFGWLKRLFQKPKTTLVDPIDLAFGRTEAAREILAKLTPTTPAGELSLVHYDLRKPAKLLWPFAFGEPMGGWLSYWRYREREADKAIKFAARQFASAVLEALADA